MCGDRVAASELFHRSAGGREGSLIPRLLGRVRPDTVFASCEGGASLW